MPHTHTWQMLYYGVNCYLNRVLRIPSGLFLLHVFINNNGEIQACVLMYACGLIAHEYSYKIEIECDGLQVSFIEDVRLFN